MDKTSEYIAVTTNGLEDAWRRAAQVYDVLQDEHKADKNSRATSDFASTMSGTVRTLALILDREDRDVLDEIIERASKL